MAKSAPGVLSLRSEMCLDGALAVEILEYLRDQCDPLALRLAEQIEKSADAQTEWQDLAELQRRQPIDDQAHFL